MSVCHCERSAAICFLLTTISKLETVQQESDSSQKDILTRVAVNLIEGRTWQMESAGITLNSGAEEVTCPGIQVAVRTNRRPETVGRRP